MSIIEYSYKSCYELSKIIDAIRKFFYETSLKYDSEENKVTIKNMDSNRISYVYLDLYIKQKRIGYGSYSKKSKSDESYVCNINLDDLHKILYSNSSSNKRLTLKLHRDKPYMSIIKRNDISFSEYQLNYIDIDLEVEDLHLDDTPYSVFKIRVDNLIDMINEFGRLSGIITFNYDVDTDILKVYEDGQIGKHTYEFNNIIKKEADCNVNLSVSYVYIEYLKNLLNLLDNDNYVTLRINNDVPLSIIIDISELIKFRLYLAPRVEIEVEVDEEEVSEDD